MQENKVRDSSIYWAERFNNLTGWSIFNEAGELILNAGNFNHSAATTAAIVEQHNRTIQKLTTPQQRPVAPQKFDRFAKLFVCSAGTKMVLDLHETPQKLRSSYTTLMSMGGYSSGQVLPVELKKAYRVREFVRSGDYDVLPDN